MIPFTRIRYRRNLGDAIPQQLNFLYSEGVFSLYL
jgi:hypothetical protein